MVTLNSIQHVTYLDIKFCIPRNLHFYWPFQSGASFVDHFCYLCFLFVYHTVVSIPCNLVVTYWERADLLAIVYLVFLLCCVTFLHSVLNQAWYLIVSIPDLCLLYFLLRWLHLWLVRVRANLYVYVAGLPRKCVVYHGSVIPMPSPPSQSHKERLLGIIWIIKKNTNSTSYFRTSYTSHTNTSG